MQYIYTEKDRIQEISIPFFSLFCEAGGKYEIVASGDHPAVYAPNLATATCTPLGSSNREKRRA